MDFEIEPSSERFDRLDDRWLSQVSHLVGELRRDGVDIDRRSAPEPGQKGDVGPLIMALGSAGLFTAAVDVIKAFVARDEGRTVRLTWHQDGRLQSLELGGPQVDHELMQRVVGMLDDASGSAERPA
jgi:Effector Associated Constant Component 1